jgi:hypothetical protein
VQCRDLNVGEGATAADNQRVAIRGRNNSELALPLRGKPPLISALLAFAGEPVLALSDG